MTVKINSELCNFPPTLTAVLRGWVRNKSSSKKRRQQRSHCGHLHELFIFTADILRIITIASIVKCAKNGLISDGRLRKVDTVYGSGSSLIRTFFAKLGSRAEQWNDSLRNTNQALQWLGPCVGILQIQCPEKSTNCDILSFNFEPNVRTGSDPP